MSDTPEVASSDGTVDSIRDGIGDDPRRYSPEARRKQAERARKAVRRGYKHIAPGSRFFDVVKRVAVGVYYDGFIHAGNLAYLSLIALFPFFITAAAVASLIGNNAGGAAAVEAVLQAVPAGVAAVVREPVLGVLNARTGPLLWFGALVGLWTVANLIETIRDILRRAYGTRFGKSFLHYRLSSIGLVVGAVILLLVSFSAQVVIVGMDEAVAAWMPQFSDFIHGLALSRIIPIVGIFLALYVIFLSLTPVEYRGRRYPKWPGALLTALWWVATLKLLPYALGTVFAYDLTYGSLAGVMIALLFFYLVGLGLVIGAELNAALAESPAETADRVGQADNRNRKDMQ